jgi:hypothetical protein
MLVGFSGNLAFTVSAADIDGVAAIGGVGYPTLSAAVEAAADGDEIDLLTNVSENVTINKKDITLDLNGNTVTGQIYVTRGTGAYNSGTLNAVIKNGTVVATAEKPTAVYAYNTTATLRDLTVTSAYGDAVYAGSSATVIEGKSTITSTAGNGIKVGFNLIIKGDDVTVTGSKYAICKDSSWVGSDTVTIEGGEAPLSVSGDATLIELTTPAQAEESPAVTPCKPMKASPIFVRGSCNFFNAPENALPSAPIVKTTSSFDIIKKVIFP